MANERVIHIGTELDTSGMLSGINQIRQMLNSISIDSDLFKDINKDLDKITKLSLNIGSALKKGIPEHEMNNFIKSTTEVTKLYNILPEKIRQVSVETKNIQFSKEALTRLDEIELEVEKLGKEAKSVLGDDLRTAIRDAIPTNIISNKTLDNILKAKNVVGSFEDELVKVQKATAGAEDNLNRLISGFIGSSNLKLRGAGQLLSDSLGVGTLEQDRDKLVSLASEQEMGVDNFNRYVTAIDKYIAARQTTITLEEKYAQVIETVNNAQLTAAQKTEQIAKLTQEGQQIVDSETQKVKKTMEETANAAQKVGDTNSKALQKVSESAQNTNTHLQRQDSILKQLASRATSLIGIGAVFNYITRGVRDAWNGIKELDKEFTQIAVVTDKTTSQLWQSFSTYSQMAQALGVTTKDAVATSALYYQQGLDTAEVMTLTAETIKMAQIAGMDFATATNQMTAALRGFNLEMSEAGRVNDIFSTLAAGAAVDTQELAYALTKTASIAESAGMSIDTTSAFLTKMIETTREAPENIGTAMKSIVARFEELKSNPLALTVEVDGEEVVANKVEKAIALAGVRLRDETTGQFRDLDDVFLELAKSWDNLDRNTQRYIATIAAGSRQQSRFIALMDGYDRTLELVEMAQDSEGQSAAQFLKTLDSLDSKLNKITNSLESLYQKFVNSDFFGGLLDSLNNVLQELGELDAGQLANFAMIGTVIINTIINSLRSGIPAFTQVTSAIGGQIGATIQSKLQEKLEGTRIGNIAQHFTGAGAMKRVDKSLNARGEKEKNELRQITIKANITDAELKIDELNNKLKDLGLEKEQAQYDIDITGGSDDAKENLDKINEQITGITQQRDNVQQSLEELVNGTANVDDQLVDQFKEIDTQIAKESEAIGEVVKQNMGPAMSAAGTSAAMALATAVTTAFSGGDAWQVLSSGLGALGISLAPQLASVIASTAASVIPGALASGKGIGAAIGAGINAGLAATGPALIIAAIAAAVVGLVALIANAASNLKSDSQRLDEELKELQKKQKQLEETSEKAQAEYAIENTKTKQLDKLIAKYDELIKKVNRTTDENEELVKVQNDLGQDFPDLLKYYDAAGNAVLKQREEWQEIVDLQKESQQLLLGRAFSSELDVKLNELDIVKNTKERKQLDVRELLNNEYFRSLSKEDATGAQVIDTLVNRKQGQREFFSDLASTEEARIAANINFQSNRIKSSDEFKDFLTSLSRLNAQEQKEKLRDYVKDVFETEKEIDDYISGVGNNLTEFVKDIENLDIFKDENNKYDKDIENKIKEIEEFIYNGVIKYTDTLLPIDNVFSNELKSRVASGLSGKAQVDYLENVKTPETGAELQEILAIAEGKDIDVTVLKSLAKNYSSDDTVIDYSKDTQLAGEVQNAISQIRQIYLQELSNLEIETLNGLKEKLSEEDFEIINEGNFENLSKQKILDLQKTIEGLGLDTTFIDNILKDFDDKISSSNWTLPFKNFADRFGTGLTEALVNSNIGEKGLSTIEKSFQGLETSKIPKIINEILSVDDWGNIQSLYAIGAAYMDAGDSAEEATEAVKLLYEQFTNPFTVNLDPDVLADKFKEMAESIQDTAKNFKDLNSAIKEVEENGKLSAQTIIDIVAAGNIEYLAFDEATKAVTINTQAIEDNWKAQMQNAEGTIDLDLQRAKTAIAGLQAQREIEQKKLDILENAAKRGGQITAEEYNQLQKLDNKYAIEVVDGQLNLNYDQLQNDADFFKDLFNNRTEMYNDLVNQAGYYGEQTWDAFLNHSQEVMKKGDYSAISSFTSKWTEATLEETKASSKVRGSSNTAYYFDTSTLEQLTKEQKNKLELIDAEIKAWEGNIEKLEKYRNVIKEITGLSLEDYMASTADATNKANKELEDYVSTLERYYNLQKNIEVLERKRTKALDKWKKTGDQKYLEEAINYDQEELKERYRLAKASEVDNQRVVKDLKKDLSQYFSTEQLELLNPDKNGYINTDAFYKTKEYQALSQDSEMGQKIDKIISDALSQNEQNLANIFDYEDFEEEYIERYENLIEEVEEINRKFDRLANINQALESIKTLQEEAKQANEEYYATGGREGINGLQYIKVLAENIQGYGKAISEEQKVQSNYQLQIDSNSLKDYFYQNPADGKYYYNPDKTDLVNNLQSEDFKKQYDALSELITKYNELIDSGKDLKKQQGELAREIRSTAKSMRQSYSDLITRLADDMAALDQKEIDEVKKKYAMIQEEDEKYLNALQKSIDKQRQLRDQAKSYDDLEEQEKRLALLERDTSGANASEIAALREQIKDARQSLVDTEQDNIVNNISEANTARKEKMDEETTFLQNVMDERTYDMQYYLDKARDIVDAAINGDTGAYQQMLEIMQKAEAEFYRATAEAQAAWLEDTESNFKQAEDWVKTISAGYQTLATETTTKINEMANTLAEKEIGVSNFSNKIDGVKGSIQALDQNDPFGGVKRALEEAIEKTDTLKDEIDKLNDIEVQIPIIYKAVGDVPDGTGGITGSGTANDYKNMRLSSTGTYAVGHYDSKTNKRIITGYTDDKGFAEYSAQQGGQGYWVKADRVQINTKDNINNNENFEWYKGSAPVSREVLKTEEIEDSQNYVIKRDLINGTDTVVKEGNEKETLDFVKNQNNSNSFEYERIAGYKLKERIKKKDIYKAFANGGLVDYTGPAWVDGTPTSPEAFLSANDTRNIQTLTEILQDVLVPASPSPTEKTAIKSGDTNIEIHLEVGEISDDYDVNQMLDQIQERISEASEGQVTIVR